MAAVGASSFVFLAALLLLAFGPEALTVQFVIGLIEPLTIYGVAGFGGLAHCVDAAGMELALQYGCARNCPRDHRRHAANCAQRAGRSPARGIVLFFAACGLLMAAKFINQSIIAVWQMNALGFLVVLGWWAVALARTVPHRLEVSKETIPARAITAALMVVSPLRLLHIT